MAIKKKNMKHCTRTDINFNIRQNVWKKINQHSEYLCVLSYNSIEFLQCEINFLSVPMYEMNEHEIPK